MAETGNHLAGENGQTEVSVVSHRGLLWLTLKKVLQSQALGVMEGVATQT